MSMNGADEQRMREMIKEEIIPIQDAIEAHNKKHEADMAEMKPYLQFASGLGIIFKVVLMIGSLALAWTAIQGVLHGSPTVVTDSLQ